MLKATIVLKLCLLFSIFSQVPSSQASVPVRNLLQEEDRPPPVTSEAALHRALSDLSPNATVRLKMDIVQLTRTMIIDVEGITLEGTTEDPPIVHCPSDGDGALIIKNASVTVRHLTFLNCTVSSAVKIEGMEGSRRNFQKVIFEDIRFEGNGRSHDRSVGGAVVVRRCRRPCTKPSLIFVSCTFLNNRAISGGAVYAEDADLEIRDSLFQNNVADLTGGALFVRNRFESDVVIRSSRFLNNKAVSDPIDHGTDDFGLSTSTNTTSAASGLGGAVYVRHVFRFVIDRSSFVRNVGCGGGGAMAVRTASLPDTQNATYVFVVKDSHFEDNTAFCGSQRDALKFILGEREHNNGGVLLYETMDEFDIDWSIRNSTFFKNRACVGGSISLQGFTVTMTQHYVIGCTFDENIGLVSGGTMFVMNTIVTMMGSTARNGGAVYGGAIILWMYGGLNVRPDPDRPQQPTIIEGCTALYGGALYADSSGTVDIMGAIVRNNTAYRTGGGLRLGNIEAGAVVLRGVLFESNTALVGGGISCSATINITTTSVDGLPVLYENRTGEETIRGRPTVFRRNVAAVGGGMYYEPGQDLFLIVTVSNAHFVGNKALSMTSPRMKQLIEEGSIYDVYPPADVRIPSLKDQLGGYSLLKFLTRIEEGHGGAVCITLKEIRLFTIAEVLVVNFLAEENEAIVGGGMSVHTSDLYWNRNNGSCFPAAFGLDTCQNFIFQNVTMTHNSAHYAGGIFATKAEAIRLRCHSETITDERNFLDLHDPHEALLAPDCAFISGNTVGDHRSSGPDAGTAAASLKVLGWDGPLKQVASGESLVIPCEGEASPDCRRPLRIAVRDVFDQIIVRGIDDANTEIALISDAIIGDLRYTADKGVATIDNTRAWGINKTSKLKIVAGSIETEIEFSTRECYPGEIDQVDVCRRCPRDQYSFRPASDTCESCERNAECSGGASLVPSDGFWHSTPFSPFFRCCVHPKACTFKNRTSILHQFYTDGPRLQRDLLALEAFIQGQATVPDYDPFYRQCADGYEDILCGSCADGYGHSFTGTCEKCPNKGSISGLLVGFSIGWLFLLIGVNCCITLMSMNARVHLVKHELHKQRTNFRWQTIRRSKPLSRDMQRGPKILRQRTLSQRESDMVDVRAQYSLGRQLVATVQLTETLKILINYLQVTSVALYLQTDWDALLNALLTVQAGSVGFSSEVLSVPFECNFSNRGIPASVKALWMRLATPFIVLLALLFVFCLLWTCLSLHSRSVDPTDAEGDTSKYNRNSFVTCTIVISIVTAYFSFINIVRELLLGVHCIKIEETAEDIDADHPYARYAIEAPEERVWAEDTSLKCFKGHHRPIGVVCVVGLFLALCFILAIVVWLPLNKKKITRTEFVSRYWFIYQAYRKEWYISAWESTILFRKAMIAAVLVYSVHLGPSLQASLCVGILIVAHILHSVVSPFKTPEDHEYVPEYSGRIFRALKLPNVAERWVEINNLMHLNILESISLASSIVMFYSAIILHDSNSSSLGRAAMTGLTFGVNVMFLWYGLYRLYAGMHVLLDAKLEVMNAGFLATYSNDMGVTSLIRKGCAVASVRLEGVRSLRHRMLRGKESCDRRETTVDVSERSVGGVSDLD